MPIAHHHLDLSVVEFRDALTIHYGQPLMGMPATCDGCGAPFILVHALDWKKGGLGNIAALAFKKVTRELVVREADEARGISALIADLVVRGVWQPQTLFHICVIDTDAHSHAHHSVNAALATAEKENMLKQHRLIILLLCCQWTVWWHIKLVLWCNRWLEHFPLSRANPIVWWWAGSKLECPLLSCEQRTWRSVKGMEDKAGHAP